MKIKSSLHAGKNGCSPEAQAYMEKAIAMETKITNCLANTSYVPPTSGTYPTYPAYTGGTYPTYPTYTGATYPDRSGYCG